MPKRVDHRAVMEPALLDFLEKLSLGLLEVNGGIGVPVVFHCPAFGWDLEVIMFPAMLLVRL